MKKVFLPLFCLFFAASVADAQTTWNAPGCDPTKPNLQMVVIDACGNEGITEFFRFTTGSSSWDYSTLSVQGSEYVTPIANPPVYKMTSTFNPASPATIAALNTLAGCNVFVSAPTTIPANSKVIAFPNNVGGQAIPPYQNAFAGVNLSSQCGKGPIYVIGSNYASTANFFANGNAACASCFRTIKVNFGGGCETTIGYDLFDIATDASPGQNISPGPPGVGLVYTPNDCFPLPCENPDVTVSLNPGANLCANSAQSMSINLVSNASVGSSFKWSGPAGSSFSPSNMASNPTMNVPAPGLAVGTHTYSVTVTVPGGCTKVATSSVTITQGTNISTNITGSNTICPNSSAVLSAGGNFSSYKWNTGETSASINISSGGLYVVTVGDGSGCNATASKSVSILNTPNPVITGATSICQGASTTLNAGAGFSSYQWSNGVTNQMTTVNTIGQYNVTVTDSNGCKGVASVNVTSSGTLNVAITGNPNFCAGKTAALSAGTGFPLINGIAAKQALALLPQQVEYIA